MNTYGEGVDVLADLLTKSFSMVKTGGILLGGDDATGLRKARKSLVDEPYVFFLELMVISKRQRGEILGVRL